MMKLAPIMLTVWRRADHTQQTIEALQKNELASESELYIFADGPRPGMESDPGIAAVREMIKKVDGFKQVHVIEREENWGLAKSIITGATELTKKYGKVIVLEDDLVTSVGFLKYMNEALDLYQDDEQVMHVSGYMFPVKADLPDTVFYNTTSTWGWGTWERAWKHFNNDIEDLDRKLKQRGEMHRFNIEGTYNFYNQLANNLSGKIRTWGIRWYSTMFLMDGFALHPGKSLVQNIGNDGSGINAGREGVFWHKELAAHVSVTKIPIVESKQARIAMREFYTHKSGLAKRSVRTRIKHKLLRMTPMKIKKAIKLLLDKQFRTDWLERRRLQSLPRYQEAEGMLLGKKIKLLDAPSFLFQQKELFDLEIYKFNTDSEVPYIVDAGANIGLSVLYFKQIYPKAHIVAFEPEPHVFSILSHNINQFELKGVELVNKGVWSEKTTLEFFAEGTDGGRIAASGDRENIVKVETTLLSEYLDRKVDFLKIDIEGAETTVLHECKDKLKNVENIFVEYHSISGESQTLHQILQILQETGFRYYITFIGVNQSRPYVSTRVTALGHDMQLNIVGVRR